MRYSDARQVIEDGDVLLFESAGRVAATIRWATRSRYSHAALAVWWGSRVMVVESREGSGCRAIPLSDAVRTSRIVLYKPTWGPTTLERAAAVDAALRRLGQPYGWWAILKDALSRLPLLAVLWRRKHYSLDDEEDPGQRVKCSTLVALAWRAGGKDLVPELADRSTDPGDLARSALLRATCYLDPDHPIPPK